MEERKPLSDLSGQIEGFSDYKLFSVTQDWTLKNWVSVGLARIVKSKSTFENENQATMAARMIRKRVDQGDEFITGCLELEYKDLDRLWNFFNMMNLKK